MQMMQNLVNRVRRDSNLNDLLRHSGMLYISGLFAIALTFFQQMITATQLGSFDYGRLAIVLSSSLVVTILLDFRTWEVGTKLLAQPLQTGRHTEAVRIFSWLVVLEVAAGLVGMAFMLLLVDVVSVFLLDSPDLTWLIRLYALSVPFRLFGSGILSVLPRFFDRFDWLAAKAVAYAAFRLVLMGGAALFGFGLTGVVIAALISEVLHLGLLLLMGYAIWRRNLPDAPLFDLHRPASFHEALRMLPTFWINSTLIGIHLHLFIPMSALLTTPAQIGIFRVGLDVMELIDRAIQPLWVVFTPKIIMLYAPDKLAEFRRYLRQCALITGAVIVPLMGILIIGAPILLPRVLASGDYGGVVEVTVILAAANAVYMGLMWTRPALITTGLIAWHNLLTLVLLVVSMSVLVWLVPDGGAVGAALAKASFLALSGVGSLLLLRSRVEF